MFSVIVLVFLLLRLLLAVWARLLGLLMLLRLLGRLWLLLPLLRQWASLPTRRGAALPARREAALAARRGTVLPARCGAALPTRRGTVLCIRSWPTRVVGHCRCVILRLGTARANNAGSLESRRACRRGDRRMTAICARSQCR